MISSILTLALMESLLIPGIIIAGVIALVVLAAAVASRYKTVPPNGIGVFYGKKYKVKGSDGVAIERGFKIITGGGDFVLPVIEQYQVMSTAAFQVAIEENGVPTAKNVPVRIEALATCRISPNPDEQANAVQAFLGKGPEEIAKTISGILRGHVRSIIASLTVEQILRDRAEFNQKVLNESADEFKRLGIQIITLVVQDVSDEVGYIEALGKQETADTIRDAAIATANAEKETKIKVSDAQREALEVAAQNAAKVADAEKQRDIQIAEFKVQTETKKAQADLANQIAKTGEEQKLRVAEARRDTEAAQAGIAVQEKRAQLKEKELQATIIVEAQAKKEASIIAAEAANEVAQRTAKQLATEAEGKRNALVIEGEGIARKTEQVATADATATRARLTAQADGDKAVAMAHAEGNERSLLAVAKGKEAALLAEATGTRELAEALRQLDSNGKMLMVMDRLPPLFEKGGDAGAKMLGAVFEPIGESLGAIKNVSIVDMGGSDGKGGVQKFAGSIPGMITEMLVKAQAQGLDITPLLKLAKVDASQLKQMIGMVDAVLPATDVEATPAKSE